MNEENDGDLQPQAEATSQAEQSETAPLDSDAQAQHAPSSPVGINPRLWFNRRPRNRRK